jgi:hypothetical protein
VAINRAQLRKAFESGKGTTEQRLKRAQRETEKAPARRKKKAAKPDEATLIARTKKRLKKLFRTGRELYYGEKTYLKKKK